MLKPVQQKRRQFFKEKICSINDEVEKLLGVSSICEVKYLRWLTNVVVVKKKNGKDRVSVDYTDQNKASSKDPFPLLHIDVMVNATTRYEMLL